MLQPPFFMSKDVMAGVAQLEQFDEELYKVHRRCHSCGLSLLLGGVQLVAMASRRLVHRPLHIKAVVLKGWNSPAAAALAGTMHYFLFHCVVEEIHTASYRSSPSRVASTSGQRRMHPLFFSATCFSSYLASIDVTRDQNW